MNAWLLKVWNELRRLMGALPAALSTAVAQALPSLRRLGGMSLLLINLAGAALLLGGRRLIAIWQALPSDRRRQIMGRGALLLAVGLALNIAWSWRHVPGHWLASGNRPLNAAKSWHFHLQSVDIAAMAKVDADLIVTEYSANFGDNAPLKPEEVARLKQRPDGRKRLVIAYFSIGEAESYRFYWRPDWVGDDVPGWYVAENCAWPRNYMVRYWHDGWKDIIYRSKRSFLQRIIDVGFDGVYLDRVDVFGEQEKVRPTARNDMIEFVTELAAAARKAKPGFIVMAQNAEDLLDERRYRDVIDGLGKEDLLYGNIGTNLRNKASAIEASLTHIRHLQWDYKPVFAVEYLSKPDLIASARQEMRQHGMIPTFAHRSLDGLDPTGDRPASTIKYGTAEWIAEMCKDKPHW
ncbi:MAG: MJ1477/TM1410 family putative glycoside hydrolase [Hyphomicrobiaceae bacterium]